ncbi:MAG: RNA ligase (ATP) [Archangiaceae bacterium]|nr:RNA ligase (ATP) [Archangiaceae bacterium]
MKRKLASVVTVGQVSPIAGADRIEVARVAGWQCVVKKGEVTPGELAVYLEIDSVPPDTETFAWLWQPKSATARVPRPETFRIRTLRLRGTLSQGLVLPLAQLGLSDVKPGDDLTERLGITRYEPPAPSGMGDYRAPFPSIVPKTDELRVQSFPAVLDELRGKPFVATVKMDGTSVTFVRVEGELHVCGRNHSIAEGENLYWYVAKKHRVAECLEAHPTLALQGEVVGPGIQKNPAGLRTRRCSSSARTTGRPGGSSPTASCGRCVRAMGSRQCRWPSRARRSTRRWSRCCCAPRASTRAPRTSAKASSCGRRRSCAPTCWAGGSRSRPSRTGTCSTSATDVQPSTNSATSVMSRARSRSCGRM